MNMRKRLIAGIIVGLSASCIGVASISASTATTIGATAASIHPCGGCTDQCGYGLYKCRPPVPPT